MSSGNSNFSFKAISSLNIASFDNDTDDSFSQSEASSPASFNNMLFLNKRQSAEVIIKPKLSGFANNSSSSGSVYNPLEMTRSPSEETDDWLLDGKALEGSIITITRPFNRF